MEPELLTTKQAASVMNIGEERARAILLSRGVQPVSLPWGKERKTLRWSRRAVIQGRRSIWQRRGTWHRNMNVLYRAELRENERRKIWREI